MKIEELLPPPDANDRAGTSLLRSSGLVMPSSSSWSPLVASIAMAAFWMLSSRRWAVTTISSSDPSSSAAMATTGMTSADAHSKVHSFFIMAPFPHDSPARRGAPGSDLRILVPTALRSQAADWL